MFPVCSRGRQLPGDSLRSGVCPGDIIHSPFPGRSDLPQPQAPLFRCFRVPGAPPVLLGCPQPAAAFCSAFGEDWDGINLSVIALDFVTVKGKKQYRHFTRQVMGFCASGPGIPPDMGCSCTWLKNQEPATSRNCCYSFSPPEVILVFPEYC